MTARAKAGERLSYHENVAPECAPPGSFVLSPLVGPLLSALSLALVAPLQAQEGSIPQFPAGVPVVVFPVQSATPLIDGSWPGDQLSLDRTLETIDAELAFAFGEIRAGDYWATPRDVVAQAARNPLIGVDPERLAYQGLLSKPMPEEQLYEPLHSQLRRIAALFDARFVIVPLRLGFEPLTAATDGVATAAEAGTEGAGDGDAETAAGAGQVKGGKEQTGQAVLLIAMIDIRRSAVMWHGQIKGDAAAVHSPALLATLAGRVAYLTSPQ